MLSLLFSEFVHEATKAGVLVSATYQLASREFTLGFDDSDEGRVLLDALEQKVATLEPSADDQDPVVSIDGTTLTVTQR